MPELDRRDFLRLVGLSAGAAAATGCEPVHKLVPYVIQPETVTPGISSYYASTCTECSAGCGLHVKTREGRPIKVEGNPDHPINKGRLCARGQVAFSRTYHPDRYTGPLARSSAGTLENISWDDAKAKLLAKLRAAKGRSWIMGGPVGPSLDGVIDTFGSAAGAGGRLVYEPFGQEALREGTRAAFGVDAMPVFDVSQADLILDLGSDFLDTGLSPVESAGQYADARDVTKHEHGGVRMISIGARMNLTTTSADQWLAAKAGSEGLIALALAKAVYDQKGAPAGADTGAIEQFLRGADAGTAASRAGIERSAIDEIADRLVNASHAVVLPPGVPYTSSAATSTVAVVMVLNSLIGAVGTTVIVSEQDTAPKTSSMNDIQRMISAMQSGQVKVLMLHDTNPVYSLPASSGFSEALAQVDYVVSFASLKDETSERAHLILPDHTAMESWGDVAPRAGVRSLVQPTIRPVHDSQAFGDTLLDLTKQLGGAPAADSFRRVVETNWSDTSFRDALGRGGEFDEPTTRAVRLGAGLGSLSLQPPKLSGSGEYTLLAFPHSFLGDGGGAALPWLQETPDPVTKIGWNSWLEMSFATAEKLDVVFGDVVTVSTDAGSIDVSAFPRGGIRDDTVAIPIGQGHTVGLYASMETDGEPGQARGANVISLLPSTTDETGGRVWLGTQAKLTKTGRFRRLALSQWTDNQRGRGLAREIALADLAGQGEDQGEHHDSAHGAPPHSFEARFDANPESPYRWGMSIDSDRCNGCSACMTACSVENNLPVVGEMQSIMHRDMNWIHIERYIGEGDTRGGAERRPFPDREKLDTLEVRHVPLPCQQCGSAPCEAVCPTLATYHSDEGINGMVYNRCIGTRYCANNCVYKVRRFNYWDYGNDNWPGLLPMMLNPDVTVRQQGVMEKCTFCVQRIEAARQTAKDEGREIADGEVVTACQQSCPSNAITFGNLKDLESEVVEKSKEPGRSYHLLQELNTRSAITYLAQVKRDDQKGSH